VVFQGEKQAFLQAGPSAPGSLPPLQQLQTQPGLPSAATIPALSQMTNHVSLTVPQQQQQQQALTSGTGQPGEQNTSATPFAGASLQVVALTSGAPLNTTAAPLKSAFLNVEHSVGNKLHWWLLHIQVKVNSPSPVYCHVSSVQSYLFVFSAQANEQTSCKLDAWQITSKSQDCLTNTDHRCSAGDPSRISPRCYPRAPHSPSRADPCPCAWAGSPAVAAAFVPVSQCRRHATNGFRSHVTSVI